MHVRLFIYTLLSLVFLSACNKEEFKPYDHPFIHIHHQNSDVVRIQANRQEEATYYVYLSSKLQFEPTTVQYEIIPGDGLLAGRDFDVLTEGNNLIFAPGIFQMPIRIRWLRNAIDPTKNNQLEIGLTGNDRGFTTGLPGPDQRQSKLTIIKF